MGADGRVNNLVMPFSLCLQGENGAIGSTTRRLIMSQEHDFQNLSDEAFNHWLDDLYADQLGGDQEAFLAYLEQHRPQA